MSYSYSLSPHYQFTSYSPLSDPGFSGHNDATERTGTQPTTVPGNPQMPHPVHNYSPVPVQNRYITQSMPMATNTMGMLNQSPRLPPMHSFSRIHQQVQYYPAEFSNNTQRRPVASISTMHTSEDGNLSTMAVPSQSSGVFGAEQSSTHMVATHSSGQALTGQHQQLFPQVTRQAEDNTQTTSASAHYLPEQHQQFAPQATGASAHPNSSTHNSRQKTIQDIAKAVRHHFVNEALPVLHEKFTKEVPKAIEGIIAGITPEIKDALTNELSDVTSKMIIEIKNHLTKEISDVAQSSMKAVIEESKKQFIENIKSQLSELKAELYKRFDEKISALDKVPESLKATTEHCQLAVTKNFTIQHTKGLQTALETESQRDAQIGSSPLTLTPDTLQEDHSDSEAPPAKKLRTSTSHPVNHPSEDEYDDIVQKEDKKKRKTTKRTSLPYLEIKRTKPEVENLSSEVSDAMGIAKMTKSDAGVEKILLLATLLINDGSKEQLVQASKPKTKRSSGNPNQQHINARNTKKQRSNRLIHERLESLEKSVREFLDKNNPGHNLPAHPAPYNIISEARSILENQNKNDPTRSSVMKLRLRNSGVRANLNEYYVNGKKILDNEKKALQSSSNLTRVSSQ